MLASIVYRSEVLHNVMGVYGIRGCINFDIKTGKKGFLPLLFRTITTTTRGPSYPCIAANQYSGFTVATDTICARDLGRQADVITASEGDAMDGKSDPPSREYSREYSSRIERDQTRTVEQP